MEIVLAFDNDKAGKTAIWNFFKKEGGGILNNLPLTEEQIKMAIPMAIEWFKRDIRRYSADELFYTLQDMEAEYPDYKTGCIAAVQSELARRDSFHIPTGSMPHKDVIREIKERSDITDILGKFTDVFVHQGKWTYRCTLHGNDSNPSGVIYKETNSCYCFACLKGGDVIDVVELFGKMSKKQAIEYLSKYYGLNPVVLPTQKRQKGGINLATT